jgi:hypothetical protein
MRKQNRFMYLFVICLLISTLFPLTAMSKESLPDNAVGEVVYLRGSVRADQPDGDFRILEFGSGILPEDRITTRADSNVEIRFLDDTLYSQAENSTMSIDEFVFSNDANLSKLLFKMGEGTFRLVTGEIVKQNPEAYKLQTPLSTIGIRGTEPFAIVTKKEETIGVMAIDADHTVEVASTKNKVSIDRAGFMATVSDDGQVSEPTATPADVSKAVRETAPMTSLGEFGKTATAPADLASKVKAFKAHVDRTKSGLGGVDGGIDYGALHQLSVVESAESNAENESRGSDSNETKANNTEEDDNHSSSSSSSSSYY